MGRNTRRNRRPFYRIVTPAKLNLRLKIVGRRANGYHDLVTVMVPIDLTDHLIIEVGRGDDRINFSCNEPLVPHDEHNLVVRAARLFMDKAGIESNISITLDKKIPVAAGLGGGSSDAASVLLTLNELWSHPLQSRDLSRLAAKLGADVPFFLTNKPALATGIGDILEPIPSWPQIWYVVVKPPIQVSTAWAYRNLKLELTNKEYQFIKNLLKIDPISIIDYLENDLETVTSAHFPIIEIIKKSLREIGAKGAIMSGSGPSVFGVFLSKTQAQEAERYFATQNYGDVFFTTNWKRGAGVIAERAD